MFPPSTRQLVLLGGAAMTTLLWVVSSTPFELSHAFMGARVSESSIKLSVLSYGGPPQYSLGATQPLGFCLGVESQLKQGIGYEVLGMPKKPLNTVAPIEPFGYKSSVLKIRLATLNDDDYVMFNDAGDVWFTPHASEQAVIDQFHRIVPSPEDTVLFSAERYCYPNSYCRGWDASTTSNTSFNSPCAGGMLAKVGAAKRFVDAWIACVLDGKDEQGCIIWFYRGAEEAMKYRERALAPFTIALDQQQHIWQTAAATKFAENDNPRFHKIDAAGWGDEVTGRIINPETGSKPLMIHFNGPKAPMIELMKTWRKGNPVHIPVDRQMITFWGHVENLYEDTCRDYFSRSYRLIEE